jgi:hypothetical protein
MRDLRKKILLESGKTVSRKARGKPVSNLPSGALSPASSPAGSRPASRPVSRAPSRYASEEDSDSDDTNDNFSSSLVDSEDGDGTIRDWTDMVKDCINEITDHKRSNVQVRQKNLAGFIHLTRHHFADTIVENQIEYLVPPLLRSIQGSRNTDEAVAANKALQMVIISTDSDNLYDQSWRCLKAECENSEEEKVKVETIWTMGTAAVYGGGAEAACEELMSFLLEIVESDGHSVEAGDNALVVTAALEVWGYLASYLEDLEYESEPALEAFTEQLESSDPDVLMAAGTNIALIYETIRNYNERAEEEHDERQQELVERGRLTKTAYVPEPYNPYSLQYDQHRVVQRMEELASEHSKSISRKDKRRVHGHFKSILTSLQRGVGPNYSEAGRYLRESDRKSDRNRANESMQEMMDGEFQEFGYRSRIKGPKDEELVIDTWSLSARVVFLRRVLGGGFNTHWQHNPQVQECLESA